MNKSAKYFEDDRPLKFADLPIMVGLVTKFVMPINQWTQTEGREKKTQNAVDGSSGLGGSWLQSHH